jgi:hypothetical protein
VVSITSDNLNINVSDRSLSNIATASVTKLTSDNANINVSLRTLSNVSTVSLSNITCDADNINVSSKSLSNIQTASVVNLTSDNLNINVSTRSLSNVTTISLVNLTSDGSNINASLRSLSNVATISLSNITSDGPNINVSTKSLSNIDAASVNRITSDNLNINVSTRTLSNITTVSMVNMTSDNLNINASLRTLSNVASISLSNITSDVQNINVSTKSLSNIDTTSVARITSDNLNINVSNRSLSNVGTISLSNITSDVQNINVSTKSLSNIDVVSTQLTVTNIITTDDANSKINVDNKTLSNLANVYLNQNAQLGVNTIVPSSGVNVSFNGNNVTGIKDLTMSGDLRVRGEFFVLNTTTCNTNQIRIENDGSGPGLVVNQVGAEHIAQFQDDSNVVFFIKNGGQAAFGSFGPAIDTTIPQSLVYMHNPTASNQATLYLQQDNATENAVTIKGVDKDIVVNAKGNIGIGTANPVVPIAVYDSSAILIPKGTTAQRPAIGVQGYIRYNTDLSSFEGFGANSTWGTLGGVKDVDGNTYISAEYYPGANDNNLRFLTDGSERMRITADGNIGIGTTQPAVAFEVTTTARVPRVEVSTITTLESAGNINVDTKSLSNLTTVSTTRLTSDGSNINVSTRSLSNITTVSVANVTSDGANINASLRTLSNISTVSLSNITCDADNINVSTKSLSNISTASVVNLTSDNANINVSTKSLSNISVVSIAKLTSDNLNINASLRTLSNVTTVSLSNITSDGPNINVSTKSLSNIDTVSVVRFTSDNANINASLRTLSNVSTVSLSNITCDADNINVSTKTLSNISTASIVNLTSDNANINVSTRSLSNVATISLANIASDNSNINVSLRTLSNVATISLSNITSDLANINVSTKSLSNITTASVVNLTSDNLNINVSTKSLSNVTTVSLVNIQSDNLNINVSNRSLSNVGTISLSNITSDVQNINVSTKSLSNIHTVAADTANVSIITTTKPSGYINMDAKSLSNLNGIYINPQHTLYTDYIHAAFGCNVDFLGNDVGGIRNLTISGKLKVSGDVTITDTTTSNTNQLIIENDGTGPALIVNQTGYEHVAQFQDDSNVVFFIKDGGQAAFGSFGDAIDTTIYPSQVYIHSIFACNQDALYVQQDKTTKNILYLAASNNDVKVDGMGRLGLGMHDSNITARIQVQQLTGDDAMEFMRLSSTTDPDAFNIAGNGSIGIHVQALTSNAITARGIIQSDTMRLDKITAYAQNINVDHKTLSNISVVNTSTIETSKITSLEQNIDVSQKSLSNVHTVDATNVNVLNQLSTTNITAPGSDIAFNFKRILDVESLVVRSNITVQFTGTQTYTNLPTDLVRIDATTGRILDQYISTAFVRLMNDSNIINPNLLPAVDTNRKTLMHTKDRVGIGLKNPQQKLHVHGTQCITSGRLGIGTPNPGAVLHIVDNNGPNPTMRVEQQGSMDILQVVGSNSSPLLYVNANKSVGIGTAAPASAYALDVVGTVHATTAVRTNALDSDTGTINCRQTTLSNIQVAHIHDVVINNSISVPGTLLTSNLSALDASVNTINTTNAEYINMFSGLRVNGYSTTLYQGYSQNFGAPIDATRIGLRVNHNVMAEAFLSVSDRRIKRNIQSSEPVSDLQTLLAIPVYNFQMIDPQMDQRQMLGFIAQEVEEYAPYAVRTTMGAIPTILRAPDAVLADGWVMQVRDHGLKDGSLLKLLVDDQEVTVKVSNVNGDVFRMDKPITSDNVLVYGEVVTNFKLLENERLLPLVFNAVKELHGTINKQHILLQSLLKRVEQLEKK